MDDSQLTSREVQRRQTRRRVYDAALDVFRRDGVAAAKIGDIADLANVSRGTFYFHFPTKDDVLIQLLREREDRIVDLLDNMAEDTPFAEVLIGVAKVISDSWRDDPRLLAEVGTVALRITAGGLDEMSDMHPASGALVPRFESAAKRGEISGLIPPDLMTNFFLINVFGAALAWCGNPVIPLDAMLENVTAFFLRAAVP